MSTRSEGPSDIFKDETGGFSAARVFLFLWLMNAILYTWVNRYDDSLGVVLTFFTAIGTPLVVWTAGPRIAKYVGPSIGSAAGAVADSAKFLAAKVQARRDEKAGYEDSR